MTRKRVLYDEKVIKVNEETRKKLNNYRIQKDLGTFEEIIQELLDIKETEVEPRPKRKSPKIVSVGGVPYNEYMRRYMNKRNHTQGFYTEVRRRDNYTCVLCGSKYKNGRAIAVHHKDWDHTNDTMDNCVCLCEFHHMQVHTGNIII